MLSLLESQKAKMPFYLYTYCLMPNHIHRLAEMHPRLSCARHI